MKIASTDSPFAIPFQTAWRSPFEPHDVPHYVVKIVKESSQEAEIYDRLKQYDRASPNHTVPCDVIRTESRFPLLVMPCVSHYDEQIFSEWKITEVLDCFRQIVEVRLCAWAWNSYTIAASYILICVSTTSCLRNDGTSSTTTDLELNKVYIIDFSESRQLQLGPGKQPPIDLPRSIIPKPLDMQRLDPYSFDVYCLGRVLYTTLELVYRPRLKPRLLRRYTQWLLGVERGCTGVCRCRPTARQARRAFVLLQFGCSAQFVA
ncbi:hypothetical protein C8T65DRAFT_827656 [Cerioporus squamosus]|nr:hypothetical protein C8T65DRAFT_827656 [Cerioporus squamosus]